MRHWMNLKIVMVQNIPYNKEWVTIQMVGLNVTVIVLEDDLKEALVGCVQCRWSYLCWHVAWHCREISCVNSSKVVEVSKPQWCLRRRVWDPVDRPPMLSIDAQGRLVLENKCLSDVDRTIMELSLRIWTGSTSTRVHSERTMPVALNREHIWISNATIKVTTFKYRTIIRYAKLRIKVTLFF